MNPEESSIVEQYVHLALALDLHMPGYVDSYFGPAVWREETNAVGQRPLGELRAQAENLVEILASDQSMEKQRREFLERHVLALHTTLRILQGERMDIVDEVKALYDVTPVWTDETVFREAHRELDTLLPAGNTLRERMHDYRKLTEVPPDVAQALLPYMCETMRDLTRRRFPLPDSETFDVQLVKNEPWLAYNWYLGNYRSRIDINTDLPICIDRLVDMVAHEAYPGHHTELSIKEAELVEKGGRMELTVVTINSPACVVSEGIATSALETIFSSDELVAWLQEEIFPRAGMHRIDAARMHRIDEVARKLDGVNGNAVFMLHDRGVDPATVSQYFLQHALVSEEDAAKRVEFPQYPLYRSYSFTYQNGYALVNDLLAQKDDPIHWYGRLLAEAVTPTQVRRWMNG